MADEGLNAAQEQDKQDEALIVDQDLTTEVAVLPSTGEIYLTINGIMRLATELGLTITEVVRDHTDKEWNYEMRATDKEGNHRWGGVTELKSRKFSKSMAINKSQRNAFNNFIRKHPRVEEAIQNYTANGPAQATRGKGNTPPKQQAAAKQKNAPTHQPTPLEKAKNTALQTLKSQLASLLKLDIAEDMFWNRVKQYFGYESSDQMTIEDWNEIENGLKSDPIAEWIQKPQPKSKAA